MTDVAPNVRDPEIHEALLSLACAILYFRIARRQAQGGSPSRGNGTEGCASVRECPLVDLTASESDALVHLGVKLR